MKRKQNTLNYGKSSAYVKCALVMNIINCSAFTWTSWIGFLVDLNGCFSFVKRSVYPSDPRDCEHYKIVRT